MGAIRTTLRIKTTDIFPAPVDFATLSINTVLGDFTTFGEVSCDQIVPVKLNIETVANGIPFIYVAAPDSNATPIYIREAAGGTVFVVLYPGQIGMFPYGQNANGGADIEALSAGPGVNVLKYIVAASVNTTTYNMSINSYLNDNYIDNYLA